MTVVRVSSRRYSLSPTTMKIGGQRGGKSDTASTGET